MRIIVSELAEGPLARLSPTVHCSREDVFYCSNIRFWDGSYDPDCLYIGRAGALSPEPPETQGRYQLQLLLIRDVPVPESYLGDPAAKMISFPGNTDPFQLFNAMSDSGFCLPRYAMKLTELLDTIPEDDFGTIAERVGNVLGRPAQLLTPSLRLLAGGDKPLTSRQTDTLRSAGLMSHMAPVMLSPASRRIFPLKDFPGETGELFCPIVHDGELREVLGYICCQSMPKADALANMPALRYITRLLAPRFLRFIRNDTNAAAAFSLVLGKIISGELKDDARIAELLRRTGFVQPKNMVFITVLSDDFSSESISECSEALRRSVWPQTRAALVDNQLALLIGSEETPVISPGELELFEECLEKYRCTAGISEPFHAFDRYLRNYFHRTFCAAAVAHLRGGRRCGAYSESCLYHLSSDESNLTAVAGFKDAFVDANLMRLIDYDASHGTEYLGTLRYYWHYNRNSSVICKLLHIQRSTLFYRLTKIGEILERDFNDYDTLIQLSVGISILEARGAVPVLAYTELPPAPGKGRE